VSADAEELIEMFGFDDEGAEQAREWFAYWESLTPAQQHEEVQSMSRYPCDCEAER